VDTEAVSLFLALLAVVAEVATAAAIVLVVGGLVSPALRELRGRAVEAVAPSALTLALCVGAVCTGGSLYFSEVAHFPPCHLCWLQRYCMYPLVPVLGLAAWPRPPFIRAIAAALAAVGAAISTYHILVERGIVSESTSCDPNNPCSLIWVERLGYLTIPTMALSGFLLILTLLAVSVAGDRLTRSEVHGHH
jgi:disulfide bond formation protein DsbB